MPLFQACPDQKLSLSRSETVQIRAVHCTGDQASSGGESGTHWRLIPHMASLQAEGQVDLWGGTLSAKVG